MENNNYGDRVLEIPIELLDDHADNQRIFSMDKEEIEELALSIKAIGVVEPLVAVPKENGRYMIAAGHRRKYAAMVAGLSTVPCIIMKDNLDPEIVLIETNIRVRHLTLMQKARAVRYEKNYFGIHRGKNKGKKETMSYLEKLFNESSRNLNRYDKLNDLIPELQSLAENGSIGLVLGARLAGLDKDVQKELYEFLGDSIKDIGPGDIKLLREQNDRGYLVLEVMQKKLKEMESELEERKRKDGDIEDLENRIKSLRVKKREAEFDLIDCSSVANQARERVFSNGNALLYLVEEIGRTIASAKPKIEILIESPFDPNTAANLLKWAQVFAEVGHLIEIKAKKNIVKLAEVENNKSDNTNK